MKRQKNKTSTDRYGTKIYSFIEKKWEKEKISVFSVLMVLFSLLVLVLVLSSLRGFIFTRFAEIEILEKESVEFTKEKKGLVIRNESVRYAPYSGRVYRLIDEGTRVSRSQPVLSFDDEIEMEQIDDGNSINQANDIKGDLEAKIEAIDMRINELRQDKYNSGRLKQEIRKAHALKEAQLAQDELNSGQDLKDEGSKEDLQGAGFEDEYTSSNLNTTGGFINSPKPGIITYYKDGFENILHPERVKNISVAKLQSFIEEEYEDLRSLEDGEVIFAGQSLFRVVDNYSWMIAIVLDTTELERILENKSSLNFSPESREEWYRGEIKDYNIDGDIGVLFLEINRDLDGFWKDRTMDISVVTKRKEGYNIPPSAIVEKEDKEGVYLIKRGVVHFSPIEILFKKEGRIYVDGIETGDKLITNSRFIEEGDRIR